MTRIVCALILLNIAHPTREGESIPVISVVLSSQGIEWKINAGHRTKCKPANGGHRTVTLGRTLLRTSNWSNTALIILLLLAGDIESNPGPATCNSCNGRIQELAAPTACVSCLRPIHTPCGFQIPDKPSMFCKVCFWTEISKTVISSATIQCSCQNLFKALNEKVDKLVKKNHEPAVHERKQEPPQPSRHNATNMRDHTPRTPRPIRTPQRKLSFAEVTRQVGNPLKASRPPRDKTPTRTKPQSKPRGHNTGTSRLTTLRATDAEVPQRMQQKALFVTRLEKDTSEQDLQIHLRKILPKEVPVQITKLRSEYQQFYASFHIAVPAEIFSEVNDDSIWPIGVRFRQFRGQLRDYRKLGNSNLSQENDQESPRRKMARSNLSGPSAKSQ